MQQKLAKKKPFPLKENEFAINEGAKFTNSNIKAKLKIKVDGTIDLILTLSYKIKDSKNVLPGAQPDVPYVAWGMFDKKSLENFLNASTLDLSLGVNAVLTDVDIEKKVKAYKDKLKYYKANFDESQKNRIVLKSEFSDINLVTDGVKGEHGTT